MQNFVVNESELGKFKEYYLPFAEQVLKETQLRYEAAGQKVILAKDFQFSNGEYSEFTRSSPELERFIPSPEDDIFQTTIANRCAEIFYLAGMTSDFRLSNNDGTPIKNPSLDRLRPFIIHMALDYPIRHLVQTYRRTSFSKRQILSCLDQYIERWTGKASTDPEYAPLYNLKAEIRAIKLDDFVSIVRFGDEEKTRIMNALGPLERSIDVRNYASASYIVRLKPINDSYDGDEKQEIRRRAREALQCTITSLRMLKLEDVGTMGFVRFPTLTGTIGAGFSPLEDFDLPWSRMSRHREPYVLDRETLRRFRRVYKRLIASYGENGNELGLLLRQFNRSCQREHDEDRVLDYVICLESALLSGVNNELSYRLALRAARLLRSGRDPKKVFEYMQCLYNVRSRIVHGNQSTSSAAMEKETMKMGVRAGEFMQEIDLLMRELLLEIIRQVSQQCTLETLCKSLDGEIVGSL